MERILVVDDEPDMVEILRLFLEDEGYAIDSASDGFECISLVEKNRFDLILLDIRMPKLDGWETLKRLKERGLVDGTKVMILTIEQGPGVEIFGLQEVVSDYLTKPFEKDVLLKSIREVLEKNGR